MSREKDKPVLDEQTLAKLLEAAYVLQEHNRELQALELCLELKRDQVEAEDRATKHPALAKKAQFQEPGPPADYTLTLAQIVETQHHIQVRHLGLEDAMSLVAARVAEIGKAGGSAIAIAEGKNVRYRGVAGLMSPPPGTVVPSEKALSVPCLKTGQVFRCPDVNPEFLLDAEECRRRGIQSMIAVPVFHDGTVAGGLELYYAAPNGFTEQDIHTCQLMAGLVTEALARAEELTWKKSLATERAAMLEALEKLQPNLAALVGKPAQEVAASTTSAAPARSHACRKCGHKLVGEEQFCGKCGSPRSTDYEPPSMQSKVASLWHMQEAQRKDVSADAAKDAPAREASHAGVGSTDSEMSLADSIEKQIPELFTAPEMEMETARHFAESPTDMIHAAEIADPDEEEASSVEDGPANEEAQPDGIGAMTKLTRPADWSSAASAREFLEQLASGKPQKGLVRFWNTRRGDIYLAVAVILVACVIRWGIWSNHSVNATAAPNPAAANQRKSSPDAGLSLFDRMLVQLGLAEAPQAPEDKGNPSVQVWVDLRTAQYYCPGADLYGKTPKGKFATQRDAQLDQFEPAYRKPCN
ncbi:MAG TPA: GAF domain-containing protein [Candidatus Dormibacteraeota bacterium]|nr:GAF domain-containing protein [Candidatus Dormibacteraeota bacterium]